MVTERIFPSRAKGPGPLPIYETRKNGTGHTQQCPCFSLVPEASRGLLKGAASAQKALRGSEMETRELLGGTEENSVSPMRGQ